MLAEWTSEILSLSLSLSPARMGLSMAERLARGLLSSMHAAPVGLLQILRHCLP